jgi:hypothetical protein
MAQVAQIVFAGARADRFDRNFTRQLRVLASIDDAHSTAPDKFRDAITPDDRLSRHLVHAIAGENLRGG